MTSDATTWRGLAQAIAWLRPTSVYADHQTVRSGEVAAKIAQASASRRAYHVSTMPVLSTDDRRRPRFWRPDTRSVTGMLRVEHEDRLKITYAEHFTVVVVYEGAFDGSPGCSHARRSCCRSRAPARSSISRRTGKRAASR